MVLIDPHARHNKWYHHTELDGIVGKAFRLSDAMHKFEQEPDLGNAREFLCQFSAKPFGLTRDEWQRIRERTVNCIKDPERSDWAWSYLGELAKEAKLVVMKDLAKQMTDGDFASANRQSYVLGNENIDNYIERKRKLFEESYKI